MQRIIYYLAVVTSLALSTSITNAAGPETSPVDPKHLCHKDEVPMPIALEAPDGKSLIGITFCGNPNKNDEGKVNANDPRKWVWHLRDVRSLGSTEDDGGAIEVNKEN